MDKKTSKEGKEMKSRVKDWKGNNCK